MTWGAMSETKLYYEDVKEGDTAPVRSHTLTRTDLVQYAGASGDFNPMHHDEVKAKAAGLPSVFGHGMFSMGFLAAAINDYVGVGNLASYSVRFVKQTWPDNVLSTSIKVTGKREEGGQNLIDLAVTLSNQDGEQVVDGTASAALPSRVS
jgi:acyl dehydratase